MEQIFLNTTIIIFAVMGFGILVFIHELGHFICAKFFGIQVEIFALGWGPKLWGFKKGGTTYQISVFPIGGFCKFKGDELSDDLDKKGREPDSFYGAAPYKRLLVALCGPLTNFIMAIIFLTILAMGSYVEKYRPSAIVLREEFIPSENPSPAKLAGMQTGDLIIKLGKRPITSFEELSRAMYLTIGKKEVEITALRDNRELVFEVKPEWDREQLKPILGVQFYLDTLKVYFPEEENGLYRSLGLEQGDIITGIDNEEHLYSLLVNKILIDHYQLIKERKKEDPGYIYPEQSLLHIQRQGISRTITVDYETLYNSVPEEQWYILFYPLERPVKGKNIFAAAAASIKESIEITVISTLGLYSLIFKPKKNISKQLGGPIRIGYVIGAVTLEGFKENFYMGLRNFFSVVSYISLALAFFNLLPFPAVDGGHIILNLVEIATRKSISLKVVQAINMIGFLILITLAFIIAFVDISNLVSP